MSITREELAPSLNFIKASHYVKKKKGGGDFSLAYDKKKENTCIDFLLLLQ